MLYDYHVSERGTLAVSVLRRNIQIPSRSFRCEQRTGDAVCFLPQIMETAELLSVLLEKERPL